MNDEQQQFELAVAEFQRQHDNVKRKWTGEEVTRLYRKLRTKLVKHYLVPYSHLMGKYFGIPGIALSEYRGNGKWNGSWGMTMNGMRIEDDQQAQDILNSLIEDSNRYDEQQYEAAIDAFERAVVMLALKYEPTDIEYITEWFELVDRYIVPHKNLLDPETAQRLNIEEWMQIHA